MSPLLKLEWPRGGRPLWEAFCTMGRTPTMAGAGPLTSQEILAYQQLHRIEFNTWELGVIHMFDSIMMESQQKAAPAAAAG